MFSADTSTLIHQSVHLVYEDVAVPRAKAVGRGAGATAPAYVSTERDLVARDPETGVEVHRWRWFEQRPSVGKRKFVTINGVRCAAVWT